MLESEVQVIDAIIDMYHNRPGDPCWEDWLKIKAALTASGGEPPAPNSASLPCDQHATGRDCWMTDISKCGDKPCLITRQA
jgi:hypothetical protein